MMNVKELITELKKVNNKDLQVYSWDSDGERKLIKMIDELDDCVDLNLDIDEK